MNINDLIKLAELLNADNSVEKQEYTKTHPMLGKFCVIRTYSGGVHIGKITYINPATSMEVMLEDSLRLWKWERGGLSLSAVANNGIKGGRIEKTGEVYLTNAIEMIPVTKKARSTFGEFIEG